MEMDEATRFRAGVSIGSGIGGLPGIESESLVLHEKGPSRVSPHFVHGRLINLISGQVSIKYGLMGPNHAVVTACSTGAHSIGDAARMIRDDDADIMLAGGAEATICPIGIAGFAQARALSTNFNDEPQRASRPYDKDRDGFVMGEGAGVVVLEEYEHAKARGAKIYAEVIGYGLSGDAYHVTAPHPEGGGAYRSMAMALKKSGLQPSDIDYINAHGTSTPLGDELELGAVRRLFGNAIGSVSMSSTKSAIGHLLGGAGAVESIFCILAMRDQIVPPTLNLDNPSESCEGVDLVPHKAKERPVRAVLNNSFGFGGTNASLIMKAAD
jgi:3-oxoacyl-[acyl-carrier-protein] synthase II